MIISSEINSKENLLIASYFNEAGQVDFIRKQLTDEDMFNWKITSNPTPDINWDGKYLEKSKTKWVSRFRTEELIQSKFTQAELAKLYSEKKPYKWYSDIEIWLTSNEFPDPNEAKERVSLITCLSDDNFIYVLSTMADLSKEQQDKMMAFVNKYVESHGQTFKLKYVYYEQEENMLRAFFHKMLPKIPFLTGWNFMGFDWLYLVNRAKNIGIEPAAALLNKRLIGKAYMPSHLGLLDYMEVFMNLKPYKVVENYKLGYIANLVLGTKKLEHGNESMMEFQKQTEKYIAYNIIDTILVKLIDDKLQLLDVAFEISNVARIDVSRIFSSVYITETLMCREFLSRGRKMASLDKAPLMDSTYDGAYVAKPVPGYYPLVACYDFASMYPNLQIQFNISPDAYLGKINQMNEEEVLDNIWTKNNTVFNSKNDSAARTILSGLYNARVETKNEIKKLEKKSLDVQVS